MSRKCWCLWLKGTKAAAFGPNHPARPRMTQIPIFKSLSKLMASKNLKIALKPCGTLPYPISAALPAGLASLTGLVGLAAGMSLPAAAGSVNWSSSCAPV